MAKFCQKGRKCSVLESRICHHAIKYIIILPKFRLNVQIQGFGYWFEAGFGCGLQVRQRVFSGEALPHLPLQGHSPPGYLWNKDIMVGWSRGTGGDADGRERRCLRAPFPCKGEGRFLARTLRTGRLSPRSWVLICVRFCVTRQDKVVLSLYIRILASVLVTNNTNPGN